MCADLLHKKAIERPILNIRRNKNNFRFYNILSRWGQSVVSTLVSVQTLQKRVR